jgi:integrase
MKRQIADKWPRIVSVGNATVKVYRRKRADDSHGYEVADYSTGKRRLRSFAKLDVAMREAERLARLLSSGNAQAAQMLNSEAASYGRSVELLRPTGLPLEIVASHFAEAFRILGGDKIVAAAEFYATHSPDKLTPKTVADVVAELLAQKEAKGRTENTISDLRARLNTFAESFRVQISSITTPDVQGWLDRLKVGERTRLNYRNKVYQLFQFSERRGYIPKRSNPVTDTERPDPDNGEIEIYTATEIRRMLVAASPEFLPCIALGAFAGLRSSEVQRLKWSDIDFGKGTITASAKKRGTPSRRFVPISENLRLWLAPYAGRTGLVWKPNEKNRQRAEDYFSDAQAETSNATGDSGKNIQPVKWKANGLRHSAASYRLAETQNVAQVALEFGNSPGTIFKHYRELATADDAKAWFAVAPESPANIVAMKGAAA